MCKCARAIAPASPRTWLNWLAGLRPGCSSHALLRRCGARWGASRLLAWVSELADAAAPEAWAQNGGAALCVEDESPAPCWLGLCAMEPEMGRLLELLRLWCAAVAAGAGGGAAAAGSASLRVGT